MRKTIGKEAVGYTVQKQEFIYKLQIGDVVSIQLEEDVVLNPKLQFQGVVSEAQGGGSRNYTIDNQGNVKLPEIGEVLLSGLSLSEAKVEIETRALGFIVDPIVKVELESFSIKVLGEVNLPGSFEARTGEPTFFDAVAYAGGLTPYANRKEVQIIRSSGNELEISYVDVSNPEFLESKFFSIHPGDVIVFNPIGAKRFEDNSTSYLLSVLSTMVVLVNILTR